MNNAKIKTYKNPSRNTPEVVNNYVPQYRQKDIKPGIFKSAMVPENTPLVKSHHIIDNPRVREPVEPMYVAPTPPYSGRGKVPNVGNNMEHTWSSVDGQIVDDIEEYPTSPDHPIIDNNDFITPTALGVRDDYFNRSSASSEIVNEDEITTILQDLVLGEVLLLVKGVPICSGPIEEIEDQVRALVFGEHELCGGEAIDSKYIMVVKKLSMKVGVFLE